MGSCIPIPYIYSCIQCIHHSSEIKYRKEELVRQKRDFEAKERQIRQEHKDKLQRLKQENETNEFTIREEHKAELYELQEQHQVELFQLKEMQFKFETTQTRVMELERENGQMRFKFEKRIKELESEVGEKNKKVQECLEQIGNLEIELEEIRALETEEQTLQICENIVEQKIKVSKQQDVLGVVSSLSNQNIYDFNSSSSQDTERVTGEIIESFSELRSDVQEELKEVVCACIETIKRTTKLNFQRSKLDERFFTREDDSGETQKFRVRTALAFRYYQQNTDGMAQEDARVGVVFKNMVEQVKFVEGGLTHNETQALKGWF